MPPGSNYYWGDAALKALYLVHEIDKNSKNLFKSIEPKY